MHGLHLNKIGKIFVSDQIVKYTNKICVHNKNNQNNPIALDYPGEPVGLDTRTDSFLG